jgi:hypothetical protein
MSITDRTVPRGAIAVVNAYLDAFTSWRVEEARALVADGFVFEGPFIKTDDKEAFFAGAAGLGRIAQGHRVLRQWADGDDVSTVYEFELGTPERHGPIVMSEWHTVKDGLIVSSRLLFDTAQFRALAPAP